MLKGAVSEKHIIRAQKWARDEDGMQAKSMIDLMSVKKDVLIYVQNLGK